MFKNNPRVVTILGIGWIVLGIVAIVNDSTWLGVAMVTSGAAWLAFAWSQTKDRMRHRVG